MDKVQYLERSGMIEKLNFLNSIKVQNIVSIYFGFLILFGNQDVSYSSLPCGPEAGSGPLLVSNCTSQLSICKQTTAKGAISTGAAAAMGGVGGGIVGSGNGSKGAVKGAMLGAGIGAVAVSASKISENTCRTLSTDINTKLSRYEAEAIKYINTLNSIATTHFNSGNTPAGSAVQEAAVTCSNELGATKSAVATCLSSIQSQAYGNLITAVTVTAGVAATLKIAERLKDKKKGDQGGDPDGTLQGNG
jgi:hypothetical protein